MASNAQNIHRWTMTIDSQTGLPVLSAKSVDVRDQQGHAHDEDYSHWRNEQLTKLDDEYDEGRKERRKKFSDDFEKWRTERSSTYHRTYKRYGAGCSD